MIYQLKHHNFVHCSAKYSIMLFSCDLFIIMIYQLKHHNFVHCSAKYSIMLFSCDLFIIINSMKVNFTDKCQVAVMWSWHCHVLMVWTAVSECKPERILKDAKMNNTSFMCLSAERG
jgi:hypothetical protein